MGIYLNPLLTLKSIEGSNPSGSNNKYGGG